MYQLAKEFSKSFYKVIERYSKKPIIEPYNIENLHFSCLQDMAISAYAVCVSCYINLFAGTVYPTKSTIVHGKQIPTKQTKTKTVQETFAIVI